MYSTTSGGEQGVDTPSALIVGDNTAALIALEALSSAGLVTASTSDSSTAIGVVSLARADVLVLAEPLSLGDRLEFVQRARRHHPDLLVVVLADQDSTESIVLTMQAGAANVISLPATAEDILKGVQLALDSRPLNHRIILAIGAHPDDVELGVGGILAAHAAAGDAITILTLSAGDSGGSRAHRYIESQQAAAILGANLAQGDLPDTRLESGPGTIEVIDEVVTSLGPDLVYTHTSHDTHQDHRAAHNATMVATREVPGLYCYASPSSTLEFHPDRFLDITEHMETKLDLIDCFASQSHRWYMEHELIVARARHWGAFGRVRYAEALDVVRDPITTHTGRRSLVPALTRSSRPPIIDRRRPAATAAGQ